MRGKELSVSIIVTKMLLDDLQILPMIPTNHLVSDESHFEVMEMIERFPRICGSRVGFMRTVPFRLIRPGM